MPASLVLWLALIGVSFAGPLVRLSHAHPLTIAIWRLGFSLIVVLAALLITGTWKQWRRLDRAGTAVAVGAGAMLALHFWAWNSSVGLTSVAASVVLVNTQPAIVALLSAGWLREPPTRGQWLGIAVAMGGALIVAYPEFASATGPTTGRALLGDLLAFAGGTTGACYFVAGRRLRSSLDIWPYVALVYGTCFVFLIIIALGVGAPVLHQPPRELEIFAALALGPMLLGHTGFNWALRYMPAHVVNLTLLGEPVGATVLAFLLPGIREVPNIATFIGGGFILAGIYWASRASARNALPVLADGAGLSPTQAD